MNLFRIFLFLLGSLCGLKLLAQSTYEVGFSSVSLEPDDSVISVVLAGYGYPPEGRFSIEWVKVAPAVGVKNLTGMGHMLYALDFNGTLLACDVRQNKIEWKSMQTQDDFLFLAGMNGYLYAISSSGKLLKGKVDTDFIDWMSIDLVSDVTAFTATNGALYLVTTGGILQEGKFKNKRVSWRPIGNVDDAVDLTGKDGRLYYVSDKGILWQRKDTQPDTEWVKIGYPNGCSYVEYMRQIAIADGHLYAINAYNELFVARHNSWEDLSARTLVFSYHNETIALIGVDLTGFDYSLSCDVKREIEALYGIPPEAILINASHTHFAPVTQWFPTWGRHHQFPDSLYLNQVVKKGIVKSVGKALKNRKPAELYFVRGNTQIGMNRSLSGVEALIDTDVDILQVDTSEKDLLLFLASCHPVFKNEGKAAYTLSPNYPGVARRRIEEKLDLPMALFLQGCAGDINPVEADPEKTGCCLADDVISTLKQEERMPLYGEIKYRMDSILFPVHIWSKEQIECFKKENSLYPNDVEAAKNVRWADMMLNYYVTNTLPQYLPVYIQILCIGQWKIIGLSREAVSEYSLSVKRLFPQDIISVLGYTNDVPSYLPSPTHIREKTYEGYGSFFWNAQPAFFQDDVLNEVMKKLARMIDML